MTSTLSVCMWFVACLLLTLAATSAGYKTSGRQDFSGEAAAAFWGLVLLIGSVFV